MFRAALTRRTAASASSSSAAGDLLRRRAGARLTAATLGLRSASSSSSSSSAAAAISSAAASAAKHYLHQHSRATATSSSASSIAHTRSPLTLPTAFVPRRWYHRSPLRLTTATKPTAAAAATSTATGKAATPASAPATATATSTASTTSAAASTAAVDGNSNATTDDADAQARVAALLNAGAAAEDNPSALSGDSSGGGGDVSPSSSPRHKSKRHARKAHDILTTPGGVHGSGASGGTFLLRTLAPGSLPPATAEEAPAADYEGPYRCTAHEVGESFEFDTLQKHLAKSGYNVQTSAGSLVLSYTPPAAPPDKIEDTIKRVFVTGDGEVVFWGWSEAEERKLLSLVRPFATDPLHPPPEPEAMPYYVSRGAGDSHVYDDAIVLNGLEPEKVRTRQQLAMSLSLARSLQLDSMERELEQFLRLLEPIHIELAVQRLPTKAAWASIVSRQLALRGKLNLHSRLLEIPEMFWSKPQYESFYKAMEKQLDISNRIAVLNKRMDYSEHVTEVVRSELSVKGSHFAEWLIIVLISLEIVALLMEKWEWWRQFRWEHLFGLPLPKPRADATADKDDHH